MPLQQSFWSILAKMRSIRGQATIERNTARGEITAKPAWDMPLPESTKRTPLSFWNTPTKMPGSSGRPTDEGNTARGRSSPGKPAVQTCLCSCRRRARPHEECEEVRGTLFFLFFFFFFLLFATCSRKRRAWFVASAASSCTRLLRSSISGTVGKA